MNDMSEVTLEKVQQKLDQGEDPDELFQQLQGIWDDRPLRPDPSHLKEFRRCIDYLQGRLPRHVF